MGDPNAEYNAKLRQAKGGSKKAQRELARLERRRVKALGQRKKKNKG